MDPGKSQEAAFYYYSLPGFRLLSLVLGRQSSVEDSGRPFLQRYTSLKLL